MATFDFQTNTFLSDVIDLPGIDSSIWYSKRHDISFNGAIYGAPHTNGDFLSFSYANSESHGNTVRTKTLDNRLGIIIPTGIEIGHY